MSKLTPENLKPNLQKVLGEMQRDNLDVGLVAHISELTRPIGLFFSDNFGSDILELPSPNRKGRIKPLTDFVNCTYHHMPEFLLRFFAERHKKLHERAFYYCDSRSISVPLELNREGIILLVDDNAYTGKTLELWRRKLNEETQRDVRTFSIAVTGDYHPDYYCLNGWNSFSWRPVGI